jgi:Nuclease-related domain
LILALSDDPAHVPAWQTGAAGEEEFGQRLSGLASPSLKVLHDRKLPRSSANIDHLVVTSEAVWVLDAKRYKGKVETRGHGLFSRRPPDLYVGGRNQMKLVDGVQRQVDAVRGVLTPFAVERGIPQPPVRAALVFVEGEFGLLPSPLTLDGVWIGWGRSIRKRLRQESTGRLPVADLAKRLARELRAG